MGRFYRISLGTLGVTAFAVGAVLVVRSREPRYGGRPLSYWVASLEDKAPPFNAEAVGAVRAIGTDALPYLLAWVNAEDSKAKQALLSTLGYRRFARLGFRSADAWQLRAALAFQVLGSNAVSALPALVNCLTNGAKLASSETAARALTRMGPEGVCALTNAAAGPDGRVKLVFLHALHYSFLGMGPEFYWTGTQSDLRLVRLVHLPFVLKLLDDQGPDVRALAAGVLGGLGAEPGLVFPALERMLNDPQVIARKAAVGALGQFRTRATSAVPALVEYVERAGDASEKEAAIEALEKIDPMVAAQFRARK